MKQINREKVIKSSELSVVSIYLSTAQRYLSDVCEIRLSTKQIRMRKNSLPPARAVTRDIALDHQIVKKIITGADARMIAEVLMCCSSGMRIGEICAIKIKDVDTSKKPTEIYIPAEISKNGVARVTYISDEATEAYLAWMTVRDETTQNSDEICSNHRASSNRVFPYTPHNEIYRLTRRLEKINLYFRDENTGRSLINNHSFRKFFLSQFRLVANPAVGEALAGHEGYLDSAYRRIPEADMKAEYLKAMPRLMINVPEDYYKVKIEQADEITKLQISAADQQHLINQLLQELRQLRTQQDLMSVTGNIIPRRSNTTLQNDEYEGA